MNIVINASSGTDPKPIADAIVSGVRREHQEQNYVMYTAEAEQARESMVGNAKALKYCAYVFLSLLAFSFLLPYIPFLPALLEPHAWIFVLALFGSVFVGICFGLFTLLMWCRKVHMEEMAAQSAPDK